MLSLLPEVNIVCRLCVPARLWNKPISFRTKHKQPLNPFVPLVKLSPVLQREQQALDEVTDSCQIDIELLCRRSFLTREEEPWVGVATEDELKVTSSSSVVTYLIVTDDEETLSWSLITAIMIDLSQSPDFYEPKCEPSHTSRRLEPPSHADLLCLYNGHPVTQPCDQALSRLTQVRTVVHNGVKRQLQLERMMYWLTLALVGLLLLESASQENDDDADDDTNDSMLAYDDVIFVYKALDDTDNEEANEIQNVYEGIPIQIV